MSFVKINFRKDEWVPVGREPSAVQDADAEQDPDSPGEEDQGDGAEDDEDRVLPADPEVARESILDRYPKRAAVLEAVTLWSLARDYIRRDGR